MCTTKLNASSTIVVTHHMCLLIVLRNVGVLVQTKHFRFRDKREASNVIDVALVGAMFGRIVDATGRELVAVLHDLWCVEDAEDGVEEATIFVVGDATSVVALTSQVAQRVHRKLLVIVQKHLDTEKTTKICSMYSI